MAGYPPSLSSIPSLTSSSSSSSSSVLEKNVDEDKAWPSRLTPPNYAFPFQLSVTCKNLPNARTLRHGKTFCVLWQVPTGYTCTFKTTRPSRLPRGKQEQEIGRTELALNNNNNNNSISFATTFAVDYVFPTEQSFLLRVYSEDLEGSTDLNEHDYLGGFGFSWHELMVTPHYEMQRSLDDSDSSFVAILKAYQVPVARSFVEFRLAAQELQQHSLLASVVHRLDTYYVLSKQKKTIDADDDNGWETVWKSEVVEHNNSPTWQTACLHLLEFTDISSSTTTEEAALDSSEIQIAVWQKHHHMRSIRPDECLGSVQLLLRQFIPSQSSIRIADLLGPRTMPLVVHKQDEEEDQEQSGMLTILKATIQKDRPSFPDYLMGGCDIDVMIAVDGSTPNDHSSSNGIHFSAPDGVWLNHYQAAIQKIASLMEPYSTRNHHFRMWGINAKRTREDHAEIFRMGDRIQDTQTLLDAYQKTTWDNNCNDSGSNGEPPLAERNTTSYFAPMIGKATYRAIWESQKRHCYSVLFILTTGDWVSDIEATHIALKRASTDAPLSVVFVGCGKDNNLNDLQQQLLEEATKSSADYLDGQQLYARDLYHFVSFTDVQNDASKLAEEALKEIPEQMLQRFQRCGVNPRPPPTEPTPGEDLKRHHDDESSLHKSSRHRNGRHRHRHRHHDDDHNHKHRRPHSNQQKHRHKHRRHRSHSPKLNNNRHSPTLSNDWGISFN